MKRQKIDDKEVKINLSGSWSTLDNSIKEQFKEGISRLVEKYEKVIREGRKEEFLEEDVKVKFLNPLLEAMGWNVRGLDEVKFEQRTLTGRTDFGLRISKHSKPALFYEAKKFTENLDNKRKRRGKEMTFAEIAIEDAWQMKVDWCVLTNFETFRLYYTHVKNPKKGLIYEINYKNYLDNKVLSMLWDLSKERIKNDSLKIIGIKKTRKEINDEVVNDLYEMRKSLIEEIDKQNKDISREDLRESVQRLMDRLVIIRTAEDKGIIGTDSLNKTIAYWKSVSIDKKFRTLMKSLKEVFRDFDYVYNSALFKQHICEDLIISNKVLEDNIKLLYKYNFDLIDADILGAIYEDYLGHILREKRRVPTMEESYGIRKEAGIYYTPISIVDYIIQNTLVPEIIKEKDPLNLKKIKVLDPSCGSGSFLIKSFDYFMNAYSSHNREIIEKYNKTRNGAVYAQLITDPSIKIVKENLFGVDLDSQAVEIASVNVLLKALTGRVKLPLIMRENIKQGNSLIKNKEYSIVAINWEGEFKEIMDNGGFDVIVGNPPWGADISEYKDYIEANFSLAKGQYDSYELFIELSKTILKKGGIWGFVIPDSIFNPEHIHVRKYLAEKTKILKIVKLGEGFFKDVFRSTAIIIFKNELPSKDHEIDILILRKSDRKKVMKNMITISELEEYKGYQILQEKIKNSQNYEFDISIGFEDTDIINQMQSNRLNWDDLFSIGRGVEFSKTGEIIQCPNCFKWDNPPRKSKNGKYRKKKCYHCSHEYNIEDAIKRDIIVDENRKNKNFEKFLEGTSINRYYVSKIKYLDITRDGIRYKDQDLYEGQRLLIRKTGVGIYATIEKDLSYVPQVVFIFKLKEDRKKEYKPYSIPYVLGVLNSRLMLYYYYKKTGEVEWKSYPYHSFTSIKEFPIKKIDFSSSSECRIHDMITEKVKKLLEKSKSGIVSKELDYEIETLVMELYGIKPDMKTHIWRELHKVQDLRIIREMFET